MAITSTYKKLFQVSLTGPATQDTLYSPAAGVEAIIRQIRIVNYSGSAVNVKMWDSGTANSNLILANTEVQAGGLIQDTGPITMDENATLYAEASAASSITVTGYGVELS